MKKPCFKNILLILLFLLSASLLYAVDFGLLVNNYLGFGNSPIGDPGSDYDENILEYRLDIVPRLSFLIGDTGSFFASAGMTVHYQNAGSHDTYFIPEILRTEFSLNSGEWGVRVGRFGYSDPLNFITNGLFDGFQITHTSSLGKFGLGAWYTRLLYKKNAKITMTENELAQYLSDVDYDDFSNTYFAPSRFIASIDWEHPSIGGILRLNAALIGQEDLQGEDEKYNSQYLTLKAGLPVKKILFEAGGSLEISQQVSSDEIITGAGLAIDLGISWILPSSYNSRLAFNFRYASPKDDVFSPFTPITTTYNGQIFQSKITGLTVLNLDYTARFLDTFSVNLSASYFIRNDLSIYDTFPIDDVVDDKGHFLGLELYGRLIWTVVSDLQFNLGGGAFIPVGNNWNSDTLPKWRLDLTAILGIF